LTPAQRRDIDPGLAEIVEEGSATGILNYLDAVVRRSELGVKMGRFHTVYELLVTPTLPIAAFEAGREAPAGWPSRRWQTWTPFTYPFNLTQQPAATVPCGFTADGLPVGVQIVGPRHADALVLRAARAYEQAHPLTDHRPPLATTIAGAQPGPGAGRQA
jgi:aspartyl-tRNA(Asn)/glutamyl-tRNA(Gln) amidotransferase subunit A